MEIKLACILIGLVMIVASASNLSIAYAFKFGRVTKVIGERTSAQIIRDDQLIMSRVRIRMVNNLDSDRGDLSKDQQTILFIGNLRPYVCSASGFDIV